MEADIKKELRLIRSKLKLVERTCLILSVVVLIHSIQELVEAYRWAHWIQELLSAL